MIVKHKGYVLQQSSYNNHYMIFKEDTEEWCLHAQCTEPLTQEEAIEHIERYLLLIESEKITDI